MRYYTIEAQTPMWRLCKGAGTRPRPPVGYHVEALQSSSPVTYTWEADGVPTPVHVHLCEAVGLAERESDSYQSFRLPVSAAPWEWIVVHRTYIRMVDDA